MGSNEADKPLRRIGASFDKLAAVAKQPQPAMAAGDFSRACSNVSDLFDCLGIAFKFAKMDYVAKAPLDSRVEPEPPLEHGSDMQEVDLRMDHDVVVVGAWIIKLTGGLGGGAVPATGHGSPWIVALFCLQLIWIHFLGDLLLDPLLY